MFTYIKHSTTDKLDYRYAFKLPQHENVYQIGRIVALSDADAERKVFHHVYMFSQGNGITYVQDAKRLGDNLNG